jgi:hypothetical protein
MSEANLVLVFQGAHAYSPAFAPLIHALHLALSKLQQGVQQAVVEVRMVSSLRHLAANTTIHLVDEAPLNVKGEPLLLHPLHPLSQARLLLNYLPIIITHYHLMTDPALAEPAADAAAILVYAQHVDLYSRYLARVMDAMSRNDLRQGAIHNK